MVLRKKGLRSLNTRSKKPGVPASQRVSRSAVRYTRSGKKSPLAPISMGKKEQRRVSKQHRETSPEEDPSPMRNKRGRQSAGPRKSAEDGQDSSEEDEEEEEESPRNPRGRRRGRRGKTPGKKGAPKKASPKSEESSSEEEESPPKGRRGAPRKRPGRKKTVTKKKNEDSTSEEDASPSPPKGKRGSKPRVASRGRPPTKKPKPVSSEEEESSSEDDKKTKKVVATTKGRRRSQSQKQQAKRSNSESSTTEGPTPPKKRRNVSVGESSDDEDDDTSSPRKEGAGRKLKNKRGRKRVSKVKLAQMKLKQMQNLGVWGTPPRRAASLNAAAMVHCLYDWDAHRNTTSGGSSANTSPNNSKKAVSKPKANKSEKSSESDKSVMSSPDNKKVIKKVKVNKVVNTKRGGGTPKGQKKEAIVKPKVGRKKKVTPPPSSSSDSSEEEEEEVNKSTKSTPSKKKKSLRDEFRVDIKDMIVKKRIASLNASAIMTASYGNYDANKPSNKSDKEDSPKKPATESVSKKSLAEDSSTKVVESSPSKTSDTSPKKTPVAVSNNKTTEGSKKSNKKLQQGSSTSNTTTTAANPSKIIASFKKEASLLPPKKNKSKVADTIIVEIEDEDIKNQLIASAMKKAGKHHQVLDMGKYSRKGGSSALPPKKRAIHDSSSGSSSVNHNAAKHKKKRVSEKIVYEDEDDEEIETITTEGAARSAAEEASSIQPPLSLNTEMNKVDVMIDGRVLHRGMCQVVHRFETISTTTAVMNRDQQNNRESQDGSRKFAPLGAIASLQTASDNSSADRISSGPFIGSASTAHSLAGFYQPAGPLIRAASPHSQTTVSSAPPTATVQPTVLSTNNSINNNNISSSKRAQSPEKEDNSPRSSPLKPTPTAIPHPYYPYGHFSPYPPPPPQYFDPNLPQQPHPAALHPQLPAYASPYHPYAAPAAAAHPHPPANYRHHPSYPITAAAGYYPFQHGGYYLAPNPTLAFPPAPPPPGGPPGGVPASVLEHSRPSVSTTSSSGRGPPLASTATHQVTLQGTSSSFNYATLGQHPYPGGRIIAPIFALAPPNLMDPHHPQQTPNPLYPYAFPNLSTQANVPSTQVSSSTVSEVSKNELAGSQKVGKGPDSQNTLPTHATAKKKERRKSATVAAPSTTTTTSLGSAGTTTTTTATVVSAPAPLNPFKSSSSHTSIINSGSPKNVSSANSGRTSSNNHNSSEASSLADKSGICNTLISTPLTPAATSSTGKHISPQPQKEVRKPSKKKENEEKGGRTPLPKKEPSSQNNSSRKKINLPKGLVITEIDCPPVLHIPEPCPPPTKLKGNSDKKGHPGLPNGLLRMATTSVQNNHRSSSSICSTNTENSSHLPPTSITRVTPKDLKSKIALCRIGLMNNTALDLMDQRQSTSSSCSSNELFNNKSNRIYLKPPRHSQDEEETDSTPMKKLKKKKDYEKCSQISMSMAQCAVSAVLKSQGAPPKLIQSHHKSLPKSPFNPVKGRFSSSTNTNGSNSPSSSRSSSRNSSLSPRERVPGSYSKGSPKTKQPPQIPNVFNGNGGISFMSSGAPPSFNMKKKGPPSFSQGCALGILPKKHRSAPKLSNGWSWVGEGTEQKVFLNNEDPPTLRVCYSSMKHTEGDVVKVRDCILLASGNRKKDLPFIAKVTALWEHPDNGEMMLSLLWYYRPEHLDNGRKNNELSDEIYASKHRDFTSVACVEDKCYVMTYNEYCRYRKFLRMIEQNVTPPVSAIPELESGYYRQNFLPKCRVAPDRVFLCRRVYESRQRRLLKNPV